MDEGDARTTIDYWGGVAYDAYYRSCGGKSIRGEQLPSWEDQDFEIRLHWEAAALAVKSAAETGDEPVSETPLARD
jgi:hypothetical protein